MSELSTAESMMLEAYGIYMSEEKGLAFSTRDKYSTQAKNYLENPETTEAPPHWKDAVAEIQDYTSKT